MILLAGSNGALLEGLAQALARARLPVVVAQSLGEAEDLRLQHPPVLLVVERALLVGGSSGHPFTRGALAAGVALVTFREAGEGAAAPLPPGLARLVLADLELPLERNRLVALAEHVAARARAVGRPAPVTGPEASAS